MDTELIQEGNFKIVKFMGFWYKKLNELNFTYLFHKIDEGTDMERNDTICTIGNEPFLTSYEWLMKIVEKIESLGYYVNINGNTCDICEKFYSQNIKSICVASCDGSYNHSNVTKKEAIWLTIINFIDWYKQKN